MTDPRPISEEELLNNQFPRVCPTCPFCGYPSNNTYSMSRNERCRSCNREWSWMLTSELDSLRAELASTKNENDALREYVYHRHDCDENECTCGLSKVMEGGK